MATRRTQPLPSSKVSDFIGKLRNVKVKTKDSTRYRGFVSKFETALKEVGVCLSVCLCLSLSLSLSLSLFVSVCQTCVCLFCTIFSFSLFLSLCSHTICLIVTLGYLKLFTIIKALFLSVSLSLSLRYVSS